MKYSFRQYAENRGNTPELEALVASLEQQFPGLDLYAADNGRSIELYQITVPPAMRGQGIGTKVLRAL